jgi:hypothetical protein
MSLFQEWEKRAASEMNQNEYQAFWKDYLLKEQKNYEVILESKNNRLDGPIETLAASFKMDAVTFVGFLDGINTSLETEIDLASLESDSVLNSEINWEKLYFNMLDAKAEWLYNIEEWDGILNEERRKEIKKEYNLTKTVVKGEKIGRNDPCPCGSGKKYKKCCMANEEA